MSGKEARVPNQKKDSFATLRTTPLGTYSGRDSGPYSNINGADDFHHRRRHEANRSRNHPKSSR